MPKRHYAKNRIENPSPKPRPIPLYNRVLTETDKRGVAKIRPLSNENNRNLDIDGRLVAHNVLIGGHRTSVRMESVMWHGLNEICRRERITVNDLLTLLNERRHANASMTGTIRSFMVAYFWHKATSTAEQGRLSPEDKSLLSLMRDLTFTA